MSYRKSKDGALMRFDCKWVQAITMRKKARAMLSAKEWCQLHNDFWDTCRTLLYDQEDGIVLQGLGYFAACATESKYTNETWWGQEIISLKNPLKYKMTLHGGVLNSYLTKYLMFSPHAQHKEQIRQNVVNGMKYNDFYKLLSTNKRGRIHYGAGINS